MADRKITPFSPLKRAKSFSHAFSGIRFVFRTQHNAWIHLLAALVVVALGWWFKVSPSEWCFLVLGIGFVLVAEAFNTAIETLTDLASPNFHTLAKIAKDVSAGAVLLAAITALGVGLMVFGPRVIGLFLVLKSRIGQLQCLRVLLE